MRRILGLVSVTATLMVAATASNAGAATGFSSVYVVAGVETSIPTNNTSRFAGGALATTSGPATFTATLTHYRTILFGTCFTYFATITGSLRRA